MPEVLTVSILEHFSNMEDPRVERTKLNSICFRISLLLLSVPSSVGLIPGPRLRAMDRLNIAVLGRVRYTFSPEILASRGLAVLQPLYDFKESLALPNGIPSHDTIARLFVRLDPEQLQGCFLSWIEALTQTLAGQVVAIDGKTLRHSFDKSDGKLRESAILAEFSYL